MLNEYPTNFDEIPAKNISKICHFAEGNYGYILKAVWKRGNAEIPVALKTTKVGNNSAEILEESKKLLELKHPSITEVFGMCYLGDKNNCLVMELMEGGSLLSSLISLRFQKDLDREAGVPHMLRFLLQVAEGMAFLESSGFIHRDIAARNILLTSLSLEAANAKLGDFGLVKNLYSSAYYSLGDNSSIPVAWSAPEILEGLWKQNTVIVTTGCTSSCDSGYAKPMNLVTPENDWHYSVKSDVWSFGVLIWEILTYGTQPFVELASAEIINTVTRLKKVLDPPEAQFFPKLLNDMMIKMWAWNKEERPTFADIVMQLESLEPIEAVPSQAEPGSSTDTKQQYQASTEQKTDLVAEARVFSPLRVAYDSIHERSPFSKGRFRGCLMGALVGSCFASYCNYEYRYLKDDVAEERKIADWLVSFLTSTADVQHDAYFQITKCVLDSLLEEKTVDHFAMTRKMIRLLETETLKPGLRGITMHLLNQWSGLSSECDIMDLASGVYDGSGSNGPMGSLRVIPIAMMLCHDGKRAIKESMYHCRLTHAHPVALTNTAFFVSGIINALGAQPHWKLKENAISDLLSVSNSICSSQDQKWFSEMTENITELLKLPKSTSDYFAIVSSKLDTGSWKSQIAAGMFAFLQACQCQSDSLDNPIFRSLVYASRNGSQFKKITAVVAGALSGAYFGDRWISPALIKRMEDAEDIYDSAEKLHGLSLTDKELGNELQ